MAGFTLSLTRDSLNMSSASTCDPSLPVFPKYEIAVISRAKSVPVVHGFHSLKEIKDL